MGYHDRAWLRATCPDARYRDGQRAFADATRAGELAGWKYAEYINTLAAAYAECGDFAHAVETQEQALGMLPEGDVNRKGCADRLALYQAKRPYHYVPEGV